MEKNHKKIVSEEIEKKKDHIGKPEIHRKDKTNGFAWESWRNYLLVGLALILLINVFLLFNIQGKIKENITKAQDTLKPAQIQLAIVNDKNCADCIDLAPLLAQIKEGNTNVTSEMTYDRSDEKAKALLAQYGVTKVPTVIVTGDVGKLASLSTLEKKQEAYVLTQVPPPYVDAITGTVKGIVSATLIQKSDCPKCTNLSLLLDQIKTNGIAIKDVKNYEFSSTQAQDLVKKYKLEKAPTIIFSSALGDYEQITQNWQSVGTVESDGSYIMRNTPPPYFDVNQSKVLGVVGIVFITDHSCTTCYDVNLHKQILSSLGVVLGHESTYDVSSEDGKELAQEYNITKVPTMFMSEDLKDYPQMIDVWSEVGTVDKDPDSNKTVYVFRMTEVMGTYKDLSSNQIVAPQASDQ